MKEKVKIAGAVVALGLALFGVGALLPQPEGDAPRAAPTQAVMRFDLSAQDLGPTIASLRARIDEGGPTLAADQATLGYAYLQEARVDAAPARYDAAEDALRSSLSTQREDNFDATLGMAILAGSRHDFHGQLRWAKGAARINPYDSEALGTIGDALFELGATAKGLAAYQQMVDLRPDLSSFGRVSYAAQIQGDTRGAIEAMQRALTFAASSRSNAAWAHWQLGELYIGSGDFEQAEVHLEAALRLVPGYGSALESTAHLAAARGNIPEAIEILSALVEDSPLPANFIFLGELYLLQGQEQQAKVAFAEADGRLARYLDHEVRPDVDFITFWADRKIHLARALRDARTLYSERTSGAVSDALGWALHAKGRDREAERYADEAIRRSPGDPGYHFHAGMIDRALGKAQESRLHLERALELDPSWSILESARAREMLAR